ncbi:MAG: cytochrome c [Planctomycetes bacterium]|nr:cytochrome c [Planctomycetota bacterium]
MILRFCVAGGAVLLVTLGALSLPGGGTASLADEAKSAEGKGDCYKLVAPLSAVMEVMESVFEKIPDKAKAGKFKEVKRESFFVAEIANLAGHEKDNHGNKEWQGLIEAMRAGALKMAEAAEKKDENGVKTQHAAVEKACDACHEKFRDN